MDYIDSCILFDWCMHGKYVGYVAESSARQEAYTSVFTLMELHFALVGKGVSKNDASSLVKRIVSSSGIRIIAGNLQDVLGGLDMAKGIGLYDAVHASICLRQGMRIATSDKHFDKIRGLKAFKPPE